MNFDSHIINQEILLDSSDFVADSRTKFQGAAPFQHLVIDRFLDQSFYKTLHAELSSHSPISKSSDYIFAKSKFEDSKLKRIGPACEALSNLLVSSKFRKYIEKSQEFKEYL